MLRLRNVRVLIALWALAGALLHAGWTPHHFLMRAGLVGSTAEATPSAATAAVLEAAEASICHVDDAGQPAHPAGKTMASSCPVCSLQVASALKGGDSATPAPHGSALTAKIGGPTHVAVWRAREAAHGARGPPADA